MNIVHASDEDLAVRLHELEECQLDVQIEFESNVGSVPFSPGASQDQINEYVRHMMEWSSEASRPYDDEINLIWAEQDARWAERGLVI